MGCLCDIGNNGNQVSPELPFLTHRQDIRDIYTISQAITFNTQTALFHGNRIDTVENSNVYIRFCKLRKGALDILRLKFSIWNANKIEYEFLLAYTEFAITDYHFYLVMQCLPENIQLIDAIKENLFIVNEENIRKAFYGIIKTLTRMHNSGIIHGQLNPHKILIKKDICIMYDLLIGLETREDMIAENYYYLAPEVLNGESPTAASDIWSLGAIFYYLITSRTVFFGHSYSEYINNLACNEPIFSDPIWNSISPQFKDLIQNMLSRESHLRPTSDALFTSDWVQGKIPATTTKLIENVELIKKDRDFHLCVYKLMNAFANTKSRSTIKKWKEMLAMGNTETLEFGVMMAKLLGDSDPLCEEFSDYWNEPIDFLSFLHMVIGLISLITQERGAILFYQLSKDGKCIEEKEIAEVLCSTGNIKYAMNSAELYKLIKKHQRNQIRIDHKLYFQEFLDLCDTLELNPSEEFVIGRFFDKNEEEKYEDEEDQIKKK